MIWIGLVFCLLLVGNKTRFSLFSPVVMFILFFSLSILLTIPYHYFVPKDLKFAIIYADFISSEKLWKGLDIFGLMLIYFSIGVLIYKYILNIKKNPPLNLNLKISLPNFNSNHLIGISAVLIFMELVLLYFTYGSSLFYRTTYHSDFNTLVTMLMEYSLIFLIFIGGVLYKENKFYSIFIALFVTLLCIGFGSRMATIYLMIYLFTIFILYIKKEQKKYFILIFAPIMLIFFGYNLSMRFSHDGHGIIPYLALPFKNPEVIIKNTFFNIYYTLIFGVYATIKTLSKYPEGYGYLLTSINPAPGSMTDWYEINSKLRFNFYAPFTGIGEIFSFPFIAAFFYIFLGMYFSHIEKKIYKLLKNRNFIGGFILFLLSCAFIPFSFEYNLRNAVRFIYYSMFFLIIVNFMPTTGIRRRTNNKTQK